MLAAATTRRDGARWSRATALDDLLHKFWEAMREGLLLLTLLSLPRPAYMDVCIIRMCISVCRTSSSVKHCKTYLIVPVP